MKKLLVISGVIIGIILLFLGGLFVYRQKSKIQNAPLTDKEKQLVQSASPTPKEQNIFWDDPAGFTISYNSELLLNKHDEDQQNYAHLEFTSKNHPGAIIVWAKDTIAGDLTSWIRTEKSFKDANSIDTKLGNEPAKKIILTGTLKKIITGSIYDGLLFSVEMSGDDTAYWMPVYDSMIETFAFKPLNESPKATDSSDYAPAAADEEETLQ